MNTKALKVLIFSGLFALPFVPFLVSGSLFFPFITTKAFAFRIIVEIVFAAWLVLAVAEPGYRPRKSFISYAVLFFLVIIGLADLFGMAPVKSFWSNFERMEGYIALLHFGALYLVLSSFFREIDWKRFWNTNLVASFIMVCYAALQLAGVLAIQQSSSRVDGTFGNASYLAVYMLFNIFIAIMLFLRDRNIGFRWVYGALIVLQIWILYSTATRGAILGLLGGLLIVALFGLRNKESARMRRTSIITMSIIVLLVVGFIALHNTSFVNKSPVLSRFASLSTGELQSGGRAYVWPMAMKGILEKPILGWGQDNFSYVFEEHYSAEMFNLEPWFDRAHDIILDWGVSGGFLGLLSYLSIYVALLYLVWKKSTNLTYTDRSIITGMIAGYFFQNLFIFDQLISYFLFFAVLSYIHWSSLPETQPAHKDIKINAAAFSPFAIIGALLIIYFVNIKPIMANTDLIQALQQTQTSGGSKNLAISKFESAYKTSRLGRPETVEQVAQNAATILGDSSLSMQEKNDFFSFAKNAVIDINKSLPNDARYELLAGGFFAQTGQNDLAKQYLSAAEKRMPEKQIIYFQYGSALLNAGDVNGALAQFKAAYDLAPQYPESRVIYLAGAILAGNRVLESQLMQLIPQDTYISDDRIAAALVSVGRFVDVENILRARIAKNPQDPQQYVSLAVVYVKAGDKAGAISVLQELGSKIPNYKQTADEYIKQIQSGLIK